MRTRILGWLPPRARKGLGGQNGCHGSKSDRVSRCRRLAWPPLRPGTKCSPTRPASTCSRGNQLRSVSVERSNGDLLYWNVACRIQEPAYGGPDLTTARQFMGELSLSIDMFIERSWN